MTFLNALQESFKTGCAVRPVGRSELAVYAMQDERGEVCAYTQRAGSRRRTIGLPHQLKYMIVPWEIAEETPVVERGPSLSSVFADMLKSDTAEREMRLSDLLDEQDEPERKWFLKDLF